MIETVAVAPPSGTFLEDFVPGQVFRHFRGKTIGEIDVVLLAQMAMNTAEGHFNADAMTKVKFGRRVVFGGVVTAIVIGLASQDTAENAIAELGLSKVRLKTPVVEGDTLYAITETLGVDAEAGIVSFRHHGINQRQDWVCEIERRVRIRARGGAR